MIETLITLLASTTFIVTTWVMIILAMTILLEYELEGWATTLFSVGIALLFWNYRTEFWGVVSTNPKATIGFILSYIVLGVGWSFVKWHSYVKNIFNKIKNVKANHLLRGFKEINYTIFTDDLNNLRLTNGNDERIRFTGCKDMQTIIDYATPKASEKKSIITSWISYWPVSFLATLLNNPFRRFFGWIYDNLSGFYDKITANQIKSIID